MHFIYFQFKLIRLRCIQVISLTLVQMLLCILCCTENSVTLENENFSNQIMWIHLKRDRYDLFGLFICVNGPICLYFLSVWRDTYNIWSKPIYNRMLYFSHRLTSLSFKLLTLVNLPQGYSRVITGQGTRKVGSVFRNSGCP